MEFSKSDFFPMLADSGLDGTILSAFNYSISLANLTKEVNKEVTVDLSESEVVRYIAERGGLGLVVTGGSLPSVTPRYTAPVGLAADAVGVRHYYGGSSGAVGVGAGIAYDQPTAKSII